MTNKLVPHLVNASCGDSMSSETKAKQYEFRVLLALGIKAHSLAGLVCKETWKYFPFSTLFECVYSPQ